MRITLSLFVLILSAGLLAAAEPPGRPDGPIPLPPPPPHEEFDRPPQKERGFGPAVWRAFSRLTEEERQVLLKLQHDNPEEFQTRMQRMGNALRQEEKKKFEELGKLVEQCRAATEEDEKSQLEELIAAHIRAHYMSRLDDNKRQLQEMKQRAARLEEELKKREANAEVVIKARVKSLLDGESIPGPGPGPGSGKKRPPEAE